MDGCLTEAVCERNATLEACSQVVILCARGNGQMVRKRGSMLPTVAPRVRLECI